MSNKKERKETQNTVPRVTVEQERERRVFLGVGGEQSALGLVLHVSPHKYFHLVQCHTKKRGPIFSPLKERQGLAYTH